ncbi:MAG: M20/M25/M40 family metallo-hydrolase [Cytophagales bacterium]|nr:M20/M25/M40 family metallo-hydrolase [Armatimonadota bacterium]
MTMGSFFRLRPAAVATGIASLLPYTPLHAQTTPALPQAVPPAAAAEEPVDAEMMRRIRDEGLNRSQVVQTVSYLTDVIGPRLTGSPSLKRANEWTRTQLIGWGLQNARLEPWGPFGRGWSITRFSAQVTHPINIGLIAVPKAWSPSLSRPLDTEVLFLDAAAVGELAKYRGKLKGKVVLLSPLRKIAARFEPMGVRYSDDALAQIAAAPLPSRPPVTSAPAALLSPIARLRFAQDEGAALVIDSSRTGDGGTLFVQSAQVPYSATVPREQHIPVFRRDAPKIVPQVTLASEQYNRLLRIVQAGETVKIGVDLKTAFHDDDGGMVFNTVAEIPGGDKKEELVMCGGHLDSWHGATGATDNAAGVGVCMEAVRILKALRVQPRRTIRIALWTGEEQGIYGSAAYVAQHFGTAASPKPEYDKLSAYFNLDNGTGKVRGIWGQNNLAAMPIFSQWLQPFRDLGATTVTARNTGSTDHIPFDRIGLPGFQFIQDSIEYGTRTHHSNQDVFDRIQGDDLKQASVVMAAFLYNAAMRNEKLPRKQPAPLAVRTP